MNNNTSSKGFINEKEYKKIINIMPVFCIDFLIRKDEYFLLLKRLEEPLKGEFWLPGGRLRIYESIEEASKRILSQEIGKYFPDINLLGFSNYRFKKDLSSRALHTPTLLFEIVLENHFNPIIDGFHSEYKWSKKLPPLFIKNMNIFDSNKGIFKKDLIDLL